MNYTPLTDMFRVVEISSTPPGEVYHVPTITYQTGGEFTVNVPRPYLSSNIQLEFTIRNADGEVIGRQTSSLFKSKQSRKRTRQAAARAKVRDQKMHRERLAATREELMQVAMHPRRLVRHLELGGEPEDF